jgi:hypothetical protein
MRTTSNTLIGYNSKRLSSETAADVRDTGQLPASFRELRLVGRCGTVQGVRLAVSYAWQTEKLE